MAIEEQLTIIREELAGIRATGENTLSECRKTNGRVSKLEDAHNTTAKELAVLDGVLKEKIRVIDRDLDDVTPKLEKNISFIDKLTGNWQGLSLAIIAIIYLVEKFHII